MIRIEDLNLAVGRFALKDVCLHVAEGEYFVLLGPTGSGKTLLIESICGLNRIRSGRIHIGGRDVTDREPRERGIGYVPQDYALFTHMTVRKNVAFGLAKLGHGADEIRNKVDRSMEIVGIAHLAERLPKKLSGGEKQRVALARALAVEPKVLLLDEPVSALDERTRDAICRELKRLQRQFGATAVHVCHNFAEMATVADRVGIIHGGQVLQVGTPREILQRPDNALVAQFVQAGNVMAARCGVDGQWLKLTCSDGIEFFVPKSIHAGIGGDVTVMVRPENIRLASAVPERVPPGTTVLEGAVGSVVDLGPLVKVDVTCGPELDLLVLLGKREYDQRSVGVGDRVALIVSPDDVHVMQN